MMGRSRDENDDSWSSKDLEPEVTGKIGHSSLAFMAAMSWCTRFGLRLVYDAVVNRSIILVRHFTSSLRTAFCWCVIDAITVSYRRSGSVG